MTAPDTTPSATLSAIRERYRRCGNSPDIHVNLETWIDSANDTPLLAAALEAVLKLADEWRAVGCPESAGEEALMWREIECGERLHEAITSALTGTPQPSEDENHEQA